MIRVKILPTLRIRGTLLMLDRVPFGMARHGENSRFSEEMTADVTTRGIRPEAANAAAAARPETAVSARSIMTPEWTRTTRTSAEQHGSVSRKLTPPASPIQPVDHRSTICQPDWTPGPFDPATRGAFREADIRFMKNTDSERR